MTAEHLPSRRTFLLRFSSSAEPQAGVHCGRIEHISTGRVARFGSLESLDQFVQEILALENDNPSTSVPLTKE